jgi:hypothetical protein
LEAYGHCTFTSLVKLGGSSVVQQGRSLWSVHPSESSVSRKLSYTATHRNSNSHARVKKSEASRYGNTTISSTVDQLQKEVMEVLKLENKGAYLDGYEKLYIYKAAKQGSIINETLFNQNNALFELL